MQSTEQEREREGRETDRQRDRKRQREIVAYNINVTTKDLFKTSQFPVCTG